MADDTLVVGATLFELLREYGVLRDTYHPHGRLIPHLVKLHNEGKIALDVATLVKNHKADTWDSTFRIDLKDMTASDAIRLVVTPMHSLTQFDSIRMLDNNVVEFWWD